MDCICLSCDQHAHLHKSCSRSEPCFGCQISNEQYSIRDIRITVAEQRGQVNTNTGGDSQELNGYKEKSTRSGKEMGGARVGGVGKG